MSFFLPRQAYHACFGLSALTAPIDDGIAGLERDLGPSVTNGEKENRACCSTKSENVMVGNVSSGFMLLTAECGEARDLHPSEVDY